MYKRILVVGMTLVALLVMGLRGWAAPQPQARAVITYPTSGMTISGVVDVTGIATHPNIEWYDVSYAAGAEATGGSQWIPLAQVQGTRVENDVLAAWDTTSVPDGLYCLALTVKGINDPTYYQQFVAHLTVNNAQPVATPTSEAEMPTPEPAPTVGVGSTPTPISIEQPATSTPRPSPTLEGGEGEEVVTPSAGGEEEGPSVPFDTGELRNAFCSGAQITAMLFLLWGLYLLAKALVRWFLRQQHVNRPPM